MRPPTPAALIAVVLFTLPDAGRAAPELVDPNAALSFEKDVRPIFKAYCFQCHGEGDKLKGGLDVRLRHFLVTGGDKGPSIVPGKPAESLLLDLVRKGKMPRGEKKLSAREIATLERWIGRGAPTLRPEPAKLGPGSLITEEERSFWAFRPVRRPAVPAVRAHERVRTSVDAFLLARLERDHLSFGPDADRQTLIRRATFDLHGLPPTPAEVAAFLADGRPDAYERLLDRLLASPRYGERWGRHWLDVAGYADSEGYNDADTVRDDAFRYRDYVIRAFNADKPFDRFLVEQLAGDELLKPPYKNLTPEQAELLTATGFLRMAPDGTGTRNDDPELARLAVVGETLKIVSTSLLGLTVGCAECHDHRFDPIPQRDYYRLRAVFEPALDWKNWREPRLRQISLLSDAEQQQAQQLEAEAKAVEAKLQAKFQEYAAWVFEQELAQVPQDRRAAARAAGELWRKERAKVTKEQQKLLDTYPSLKVAPNATILNLFLAKYNKAGELKQVIDDNQKEAAAVRARKPAEGFIRALTEVPGKVPVTQVFLRGDRTRPGEAVPPGDLAVLSPDRPRDFPLQAPGLPTTGRRLAFARRLTDGTHPLTARVLVNRFWLHHFGRGLVATPADFGTQGERPTHPELLDWLASEFTARGWSLKTFHRLLMTSTAYRQSSARREAGERVDATNALYWRMSVRRLEAEAVRDAVLAATGKLNLALYGPPVPVTLDENSQAVVGDGKPSADGREFRRSIYVQVRRSTPAYMLSVFDAPALEPNCEARNVSTVAQQSLLLMNSRFVVEQAEAFARRVRAEAGADPKAQVRLAWRLSYSAELPDDQLSELLQYLDGQAKLLKTRAKGAADDARLSALASLCQVLLDSNRFLYVD